MHPARLLLFVLCIWIVDSAVIAAPPFELDRKALNAAEDLSESLANDLLDLSIATRQKDMMRISGFFAASLLATPMPGEYTDLTHRVKWVYTHDWVIRNTPFQLAREDFLENYASFLNHFSQIEEARFEVKEADFDHPTAGRASIYFYLIGRGCGGHREWVRGHISIKAQRPVADVSVEKWKINEFTLETMESQVSTRDIFSEVSSMAGMASVIPSGLSDNESLVWHGAAAADVDLDGNLDIFVTSVTRNYLYLNEGNGRFRDAAAEVNIQHLFSMGVAPLFLDYDNDGDLDLFISAVSDQMLFENRLIPDGVLNFFDVSAESGVALPAVGFSAVAGDVNNDGLPDIYVTSYNLYGWVMPNSWTQATNGTPNLLFINQGGGQFKEMAKEMGVEDTRWSFAAQFVDIDGNGYQDLYISNDFGENALFLNQGSHFVDVAPAYKLTGPDFGMGVSFGDYDNDSDLDLYITSMSSTPGNRMLKRLFPTSHPRGDLMKKVAAGSTLYENSVDGTFKNVTMEAGVSSTGWSWGGGFIDLDNDGWEDIYTPNGFISGESMKDTGSFSGVTL